MTVLNGTPAVANQAWTGFPVTVFVKGGLQIGVQYSDGAGTPNDSISTMIERLS